MSLSLKLAGGFVVKQKGYRASVHDAPILVLAPHSSFLDYIALTSLKSIAIMDKNRLYDNAFMGKNLII